MDIKDREVGHIGNSSVPERVVEFRRDGRSVTSFLWKPLRSKFMKISELPISPLLL